MFKSYGHGSIDGAPHIPEIVGTREVKVITEK